MNTYHYKQGQPYALHFTDAAATDFDPSTPTAVSFKVERPDGSMLSWAGTIVSQSPTAITVKAPFPVGMPDQLGVWTWWVQYTVAGQTPGPRSDSQQFLVIAADDITSTH